MKNDEKKKPASLGTVSLRYSNLFSAEIEYSESVMGSANEI